jgi:hypothetical protein
MDYSKKGSGGIGQHYADLVHNLLLIVGHDQKFESATQALVIAHHRAQLHDVRGERNRKLHRNDLAGLQLTAEGCTDAVLAEFVGSAPACGRQAFAKHRHLDAHVKTITGEAPASPLSVGGGSLGVAQSSISISGLPFKGRFRLCLSAGSVLNVIKGQCTNEERLCLEIRRQFAEIAHIFSVYVSFLPERTRLARCSPGS